MKKTLNWVHGGKEIKSLKDVPKEAIGFIYLITNLTNGRYYIGKKNLFHVTNPQISKRKYDQLKAQGIPVTKTKDKRKSRPGKPVWRYKEKQKTTETNWKTYNGSNQPLLEDISKGHQIHREIVRFCDSHKELTYREIEQIVKHECLDHCDCYNQNVLGKIFSFVKC